MDNYAILYVIIGAIGTVLLFLIVGILWLDGGFNGITKKLKSWRGKKSEKKQKKNSANQFWFLWPIGIVVVLAVLFSRNQEDTSAEFTFLGFLKDWWLTIVTFVIVMGIFFWSYILKKIIELKKLLTAKKESAEKDASKDKKSEPAKADAKKAAVVSEKVVFLKNPFKWLWKFMRKLFKWIIFCGVIGLLIWSVYCVCTNKYHWRDDLFSLFGKRYTILGPKEFQAGDIVEIYAPSRSLLRYQGAPINSKYWKVRVTSIENPSQWWILKNGDLEEFSVSKIVPIGMCRVEFLTPVTEFSIIKK